MMDKGWKSEHQWQTYRHRLSKSYVFFIRFITFSLLLISCNFAYAANLHCAGVIAAINAVYPPGTSFHATCHSTVTVSGNLTITSEYFYFDCCGPSGYQQTGFFIHVAVLPIYLEQPV